MYANTQEIILLSILIYTNTYKIYIKNAQKNVIKEMLCNYVPLDACYLFANFLSLNLFFQFPLLIFLNVFQIRAHDLLLKDFKSDPALQTCRDKMSDFFRTSSNMIFPCRLNFLKISQNLE